MHGTVHKPVRARLALDTDDYHQCLADVVRQAGAAGFYQKLAEMLIRLTGCSNYLVLRYTPHGAPSFLINEAISQEAVRLYLTNLYHLDPLYNLSRKTREPRVVCLRSLDDGATSDERYMRELLKSFFIYDELAILLPVPGGVSIAVCCDRQRRKFDVGDRKVVERILPVVASLHKLHLDRAFALASTRGDPQEAGQQIAFLVLDDDGRVVHESTYWHQLGLSPTVRNGILAMASAEPDGEAPTIEDYVVRWEGLAVDFQLAPGGKIITIERSLVPSPQLTLEDGLEAFRQRWHLTNRETDIIRLILVGQPNSHISRNLGISLGTVKNHRHRLYNKLDITTERELFSMFLSQMIGRDFVEAGIINGRSP